MTVRKVMRDVYRMFADNPRKWTKKTMCAGTGRGTCYCMVGGMRKAAGLPARGGRTRWYHNNAAYVWALRRVVRVINPLDVEWAKTAKVSSLENRIIHWNDHQDRTLRDILRVSRIASRV